MREVVLKLDKIAVTSFDPRALAASLRIFYSKDNEQGYFDISHQMTTKSEAVILDILKELKKRGSIQVEDDDLLGSIYVKKFVNEDKAEERMMLFISKLHERGKIISREKNHTKYMALLDEIKHMQMVI